MLYAQIIVLPPFLNFLAILFANKRKYYSVDGGGLTHAHFRKKALQDFWPLKCSFIFQYSDHQLGRFISESNYRWFPHDEEPDDPG